jgi:ATP-dependent DNA helicase RecQ
MPSEEVCTRVLRELDSSTPRSIPRLETAVNMGRSRLTTLLSILDVQGAVRRTKGGWLRTTASWTYDAELADRLRALRSSESEQMAAYPSHAGCRLRYLRDLLDDEHADDCGRCDRCLVASGATARWSSEAGAGALEARDHLRGVDVAIEPRRQWAPGLDEPKGKIVPGRQARWGRGLGRVGDGGWDPIVAELLDGTRGQIPPELINGIVGILRRWDWEERPGWICPMPSRRNGVMIDAVADEIGGLGNLPVHRVLRRNPEAGWQAEQSNSAFQLANVWGLLDVVPEDLPEPSLRSRPVLLIDDTADSRWTITVATHALLESGTGPVLPFVLQTR